MSQPPARPASPAAVRRQRTDLIIEVVRTADPSLSVDMILGSIERVAAAPISRSRLARYLSDNPGCLTTGDSAPPKVVGALIAALVDAGSTVLVVPRCSGCGRQIELFHTRGPTERICVACYNRTRTAECVECGRERPIAAHDDEGRPRCAMCHNRAHQEECGRCGRVKQVAGRNPDGSSICSACVRRDTGRWRPCSVCGRDRPVNGRTEDGGQLCPSCYQSPPETCSSCGEERTVASRLAGEPVCYSCYRHPQRECGRCGRVRRVAVAARDGQPDLCPTCHQAPTLLCSRCGNEDLCRTTTPDKSPICFRCQLARKLDEILGASDGDETPAVFVVFRSAVMSVDNPRTAIGWLGRSPAIDVLHQMATGRLPLEHATLDTVAGPKRGQAFAVEHLRQLLVASGALAPRDRHLARLELALEELIGTADPNDRQVLRAYATWHLLHRLRQKADPHDGTRPGAAYRVRDELADVARFLAWLRGCGVLLVHVSQRSVDEWVTGRPRSRPRLAIFLKWAHRQQLCPPREVVVEKRGEPKWFVSDETRWAQARRMLTDNDLEVRDRIAGALVLLYGQTAARITRLARADIIVGEAAVRVRLGRDLLDLPPPLDDLIQRLPDVGPVGIASKIEPHRTWLFPGRRPDLPMTPTNLARRLKNLGIEPRAARNTALLQLAAELPSVAIADLLGIHINTAEKWTAAAGARWAAYVRVQGE